MHIHRLEKNSQLKEVFNIYGMIIKFNDVAVLTNDDKSFHRVVNNRETYFVVFLCKTVNGRIFLFCFQEIAPYLSLVGGKRLNITQFPNSFDKT